MADPSELTGTSGRALRPTASHLPQKVERAPVPTWSEIGDSFEVLGKVGLAMAIGFSAAGLFCRLAEQGRVRVPSLPELVLNGERTAAKSTDKGA